MGIEPFQQALKEGAQVVLGGALTTRPALLRFRSCKALMKSGAALWENP